MRKSILKASALLIIMAGSILSGFSVPPAKQMYYEVRLYRINGKAQEALTDSWLKDAYLPALHRAGIQNVGVFKPVEADTAYGKFIYVLIPFKTLDQYGELPGKLQKDQAYAQAAKAFIDAPYNEPPFVRYESILARAFTHFPEMKVPVFTTPKSERIYEYRSYESATEAKADKKIEMFNEGGESKIFENIGSNPVFFAKVISGSKMPRLIYMTTYADMKSHDEHWAAFRAHPEWKRLSSMEEYKNTTSKVNPYLLHPADYSDF